MTKQKIFNKVVAGLASQGFKQSVSEETGLCRYREGNKKCAAGWLIDDAVYDATKMECRLANETLIIEAMARGGVPASENAFVRALQQIHDKNPTPKEMLAGLRAAAIVLTLSQPYELRDV